jgi:hypothetical protein
MTDNVPDLEFMKQYVYKPFIGLIAASYLADKFPDYAIVPLTLGTAYAFLSMWNPEFLQNSCRPNSAPQRIEQNTYALP